MDEFFSLMYLTSKKRIIEEIIKQTRQFSLEKYFNDEYISEDDSNSWDRNMERAAVIRITRRNRYNMIVFTYHAAVENRLDYVLYRNKI